MPKEKKVKEDNVKNDAPNSEESFEDISEKENLGSPTYEELVDINEELEKSILRANADLDNALKRTINEVDHLLLAYIVFASVVSTHH
jgi:molecular chaperone GrpE (heat shock protein)